MPLYLFGGDVESGNGEEHVLKFDFMGSERASRLGETSLNDYNLCGEFE